MAPAGCAGAAVGMGPQREGVGATAALNRPSAPQDVFCLHTPGGGGYGDPEDPVPPPSSPPQPPSFSKRGSVYEYRRAQEAV